jgi:tetratricopeptide (TPR) repeat protein
MRHAEEQKSSKQTKGTNKRPGHIIRVRSKSILKVRLGAPLLKTDPRNPKVLLLAFSASTHIGDALADRGDEDTLAPALDEFRYAEGLAQTMADMAPDNGARQRNIMFVLHKIGDIRQEQKSWDLAIAEYTKALGIIAPVAKKYPDKITWQRDVANCHSRLGQALAGKEKFDDALAELRTAYSIRSSLADRKDNVTQSNLALSHIEFARVYEAQQKLEQAENEFRSAIKIRQEISDKDPTNAAWLIPLSATHMDLGRVLRADRKWSPAYKRAVDIRQGLATRDPTNVYRQNTLAVSRYDLAETLVLLNREDEALQNYSDAADALEDLAENLAKSQPKKAAGYGARGFDARIKMCNIEDVQGKNDKALEDYRKALTIAQQFASEDESDASWQRKLASVHEKIGDDLVVNHDPGGALDEYKAALATIKKLSEGSSDPELIQLVAELQAKMQPLLPKG